MKKFLPILLLLTVFHIEGCAPKSNENNTFRDLLLLQQLSTSNRQNFSYQGAGSTWSLSFIGGNFELKYEDTTNTSNNYTATGTFQEFSNRFRRLTVSAISSTSNSNAPSVGGQAEVLEVPGFAVFLRPIAANAQPITMIRSGNCPTATFETSTIIAKYNTNPSVSAMGFGSMTFNPGAGTITINAKQFINGEDSTGLGVNPRILSNIGSCDNGKYAFTFNPGSGNQNVEVYATANGGALIKAGATNGELFIFNAAKQSSPVTTARLAGIYSGLLFQPSDGARPAKLELNASGVGTATQIDPSTDQTNGSSASVIINQPYSGIDGIVRGKITLNSTERDLNCSLSNIDGNQILACNADGGRDGGGNITPAFFLGVRR